MEAKVRENIWKHLVYFHGTRCPNRTELLLLYNLKYRLNCNVVPIVDIRHIYGRHSKHKIYNGRLPIYVLDTERRSVYIKKMYKVENTDVIFEMTTN